MKLKLKLKLNAMSQFAKRPTFFLTHPVGETKNEITLGEDTTGKCAVSETDERAGVVEEEKGATEIVNTDNTKEAT